MAHVGYPTCQLPEVAVVLLLDAFNGYNENHPSVQFTGLKPTTLNRNLLTNAAVPNLVCWQGDDTSSFAGSSPQGCKEEK